MVAAMSERSRLSQVRRKLLNELKEEVRFHIGPIPSSLRRYYRQYKDGFDGRWRASTKDELIEAVRGARIVLLGDYHTLRQSQRATLRILRELVPGERRVRLGLEMVRAEHQGHLDRYLAGEIDRIAFLRSIDYVETWGFPWEGYGEILEFARNHGLPVHGLNVAGTGDADGLRKRDRHAAGLLADLAVRHPEDLIHVVFGDLHLAPGHLPGATSAALEKAGLADVTPLVILQNSETLFWKLHRRRLQHRVDVVRLGRHRFCINSTPPWVKLHSFLFWERNRAELLTGLMGGQDGAAGAESTGEAVEYSEQQASLIRLVAGYFGLRPAGMDDFTVLTLAELNRMIATLSRLERFPVLEPLLLTRESLFIPERRIIFLRGPDMNHAAEQAAVFLNWLSTRYRPEPEGGQDEFYRRTIRRALGFLGSLVVNPRRFLERSRSRRRLGPRGPAQRRASRQVLTHLEREGKRQGLVLRNLFMADDAHLRLISTGLGQILGYRLYHGMLQGAVRRDEVTGLFSLPLVGRHEARDLYLHLKERLGRVVPVVLSKSHRF
jgi:hypothetical protein